MRKFLAVLTTALLGVAGFAASVATGAEGPKDGKVTLCHATGSATNPFVKIEVAAAGAFNGHLGKSHQDGRDIIPPFTFNGKTYSQNWDSTGQATFNNGCKPVSPPTTTPPAPPAPPAPPVATPPAPAPTCAPGTVKDEKGSTPQVLVCVKTVEKVVVKVKTVVKTKVVTKVKKVLQPCPRPAVKKQEKRDASRLPYTP